MKNLTRLTTLLFILLQTACISAPTIPTGTSTTSSATNPSTSSSDSKAEKTNPKDFKRTDYLELPQDQQKLNKVLLDYEHSHDMTDISHQLRFVIARSPAVAKYLIDHDLIRQDANYADYLTQIALRTIIQSGQIDPYLDKYWGHVLYQSDAHVEWFDVGFAAQAAAWAAVNLNHPNSQKNLAIYSMRACLSFDLARVHSIVVPKEPNLLSLVISDKCQEYPAEAAKWAGQYLANEKPSRNEKVALLNRMADYYFDTKDYAHAASYYKLQLELANQHGLNAEWWKSFADTLSLKQQLGSGTSIEAYLEILARQQQFLGERAYKRLTLIKNSGVLQFADYGL